MNEIELSDMVHLMRAITDQARHDAQRGDEQAQAFLQEFRAPSEGKRESSIAGRKRVKRGKKGKARNG